MRTYALNAHIGHARTRARAHARTRARTPFHSLTHTPAPIYAGREQEAFIKKQEAQAGVSVDEQARANTCECARPPARMHARTHSDADKDTRARLRM
jgi:hypothetical protein